MRFLVVLVNLHLPLHFLRRGFNVNLITEIILHDLMFIELLVFQQVQCIVSLLRPVVGLVHSLLFLNISSLSVFIEMNLLLKQLFVLAPFLHLNLFSFVIKLHVVSELRIELVNFTSSLLSFLPWHALERLN